MIYLFDAKNRQTHGQYLEKSFKQRYFFFHEYRGWDVCHSFFKMEIDQYDDACAIYLISIDHKGRIMGGIRATNTSAKSYISEFHGKDIYDPAYPARFNKNTWEMYRLWVSNPTWKSHSGHKVRTELMLSLMEYLADFGAKYVLATGDIPHLKKIPHCWQLKEIGPRYKYKERRYDEKEAFLAEIKVSKSIVEQTKRALGYEGKHYVRAESSLEAKPSIFTPDDFYLMNNWLRLNPEHIEIAQSISANINIDPNAVIQFKEYLILAAAAKSLAS